MDLPSIDWDLVGPKLIECTVALRNRLTRQPFPARPEPPGARTLLRYLLLASENAFTTIRTVCYDALRDRKRVLEHSMAMPPLVRVVMEALFTVVFLFEDLQTRTHWYYASGWREMVEHYQRYVSTYGSDAEWKPYLDALLYDIDKSRLTFGITKPESDNPTSIERWPLPDRMVKSKHALSAARREHLSHMLDLYYREPSQSAHLSYPGLAKAAGALPLDMSNDTIVAAVEKNRSDIVMTATVLMMSLLSELEGELNYGHATQLCYVWGVLKNYSNMTLELYTQRYQQLLSC